MTDHPFRGGNVAPPGSLAAELEQLGVRHRVDPFRTAATTPDPPAKPTTGKPTTGKPAGDIDQGSMRDSSRGEPQFKSASPEVVRAELDRIAALARREGATTSRVQLF